MLMCLDRQSFWLAHPSASSLAYIKSVRRSHAINFRPDIFVFLQDYPGRSMEYARLFGRGELLLTSTFSQMSLSLKALPSPRQLQVKFSKARLWDGDG